METPKKCSICAGKGYIYITDEKSFGGIKKVNCICIKENENKTLKEVFGQAIVNKTLLNE
ncbi:MAG: hypothetical protein RSE41_02450 [Clostridia bacterium]